MNRSPHLSRRCADYVQRPSFAAGHRATRPLVTRGSGFTGRESWLPVLWFLGPIVAVLAVTMAVWMLPGSEQPKPRNAVHAQLLRFKAAIGDTETAAERFERLGDAADAIVAAAGSDQQLQAALVTIGWFEAHYSQLVAEGRCLEHRYRCDYDRRTGLPKSRSYFQLQAPACAEIHQPGPPDVRAAAKCAARLWRYGRARCGSDAGAFSLYGTGGKCEMPDAEKRSEFMRRVAAQL